jgi:Rod binding domain-containing protein
MTDLMPATAAAPSALQSLKPGALLQQDAKTGVPDNIKQAAQQFEAVFLGEMFSHMFDGVKVDPMFGGGQGEKMFRSMLVQEYGKEMAKGQGIGISSQLQSMMLKMQEARQTKLQ